MFSRNMRTLSIVAVWAALLVAVENTAKPQTMESVQRAVDDILSQYGGGGMRETEAHARLSELPDEAVVVALVTALNREPSLKEGRHNFAYRMLGVKHAARTEVGFQQLTSGLFKPEVAPDCAEALLDAHPEKQAEALGHIRRYLELTKTPVQANEVNGWRVPPSRNELDVKGVLRAIASKGASAVAYLDVLDAILRDPERDVDVRTAAASAIVNIKSLHEALKHFQGLDDAGMEGALKAWPRAVAELMHETRKAGKSFRHEYPELLDALRQLVVMALHSARPETQEAALEPMGLVYGHDLVVIRSAEDYEYNPQLRPMLENMGRNHPDPGVRSQVQRFLGPQEVDRMVANILRERERQAQQKDQEP